MRAFIVSLVVVFLAAAFGLAEDPLVVLQPANGSGTKSGSTVPPPPTPDPPPAAADRSKGIERAQRRPESERAESKDAVGAADQGPDAGQRKSADSAEAETLPAPKSVEDNTWRFRWHNGTWWYWLPSNRWVIWSNGAWVNYSPPAPQASAAYGMPADGYAPSYDDGYDDYGYGDYGYASPNVYSSPYGYGSRYDYGSGYYPSYGHGGYHSHGSPTISLFFGDRDHNHAHHHGHSHHGHGHSSGSHSGHSHGGGGHGGHRAHVHSGGGGHGGHAHVGGGHGGGGGGAQRGYQRHSGHRHFKK